MNPGRRRLHAHTCAFRDLFKDLTAAARYVFGLSDPDTAYHAKVERLHVAVFRSLRRALALARALSGDHGGAG